MTTQSTIERFNSIWSSIRDVLHTTRKQCIGIKDVLQHKVRHLKDGSMSGCVRNSRPVKKGTVVVLFDVSSCGRREVEH